MNAQPRVGVDVIAVCRPLASRVHLDHEVTVPHERQLVSQGDAGDARRGGEILAHAPHRCLEAVLAHLARPLAASTMKNTPKGNRRRIARRT
jgi:hypothetical protein